MDTVTRCIPIPIYFTRGEGCKGECNCPTCQQARQYYQQIKNGIHTYRHTCRKAAAVLFLAEAAGSEITQKNGEIRIIPKTHPHETKTNKKTGLPINIPDSKLILEATFQKIGEYHGYAMRDWIKQQLGTLRSDISDAARDDVVKVWQAKDAEFPKATRGYLCLNFARRVAQFNNIGIPIRTSAIKLEDHTFKFSIVPGEYLEAKIGTLDGSRWGIIKKIKTGEWKMGDPIRINLNSKGELIIYMAYTRPPERTEGLDPNRELECAFTTEEGKFIEFRVREGQKTYIDDLKFESLGAAAALEFVDKLSKQTIRGLEKLKSCGSRSERTHGSGNRIAHLVISERSKRISKTRENGCRTWNHTWSHRVINVAKKWNCARIKVFDIPDNLFGRSWQWADFKGKLEYKAEECGIKLEFMKTPKLSLVTA